MKEREKVGSQIEDIYHIGGHFLGGFWDERGGGDALYSLIFFFTWCMDGSGTILYHKGGGASYPLTRSIVQTIYEYPN